MPTEAVFQEAPIDLSTYCGNEPAKDVADATKNADKGGADEANCGDSVHDADIDGSNEDQGVEVVLGGIDDDDGGKTNDVVTKEPRATAIDQNVFRSPQQQPQSAPMRPRMHQRAPPPHPYSYTSHGSGSWGYGPPPPHHYHRQHHYPPGDYPPPPSAHRPYQVPSYAMSGSFDEASHYRQHHQQYEQQHHPHHPASSYYNSPHGPYPPGPASNRRYGPDVNVISPHHHHGLTPRPRAMESSASSPARASTISSHRYPPSSPVCRPAGPPRVRDYAMSRRGQQQQRGEGSSRATQYSSPPDKDWSLPSPTAVTKTPSSGDSTTNHKPTMVADPSFESTVAPHPTTPGSVMLSPPESNYQLYGSWGASFDGSLPPPPPQFDGYSYGPPPESPYSPYSMLPPPPAPTSYSNPGNIYYTESFPPPMQYGPNGSFSYSYDVEDSHHRGGSDYNNIDRHPHANKVTPKSSSSNKSRRSKSGATGTQAARDLLPKAAEEIDFDVASPPMEPIEPEATEPVCGSLSEVNGYDVLCGRGGGTNSQIGNRRFRKLVQEFQPIYLLARRKEKPLMARTIVLIIRKRGGRFLKKDDETGEMYEVGDVKAEAKTSQALREGLDVRATKSAAGSLLDKKQKKKADEGEEEGYGPDDIMSPMSVDKDGYSPIPTSQASSVRSPKTASTAPTRRQPESPPALPRLVVEDVKSISGVVHPHSPDQEEYRKRRRMRVNAPSDRFFPEFCPPRADLPGRPATPLGWNMACNPLLRHSPSHDDDIRYHAAPDDASMPDVDSRGCAGAALDIVKGAAASGFACLGPSTWRR